MLDAWSDRVAPGVRPEVLFPARYAELHRLGRPLAELVDRALFGGFSLGEIAGMRDVSERTVQRPWEGAPLYLPTAIPQPPGPAGARGR
jgi:hypothetical protein